MNTQAKRAGSSYEGALSAVTAVKLKELEIQKFKLDAHYNQVLKEAEECPELLKKLDILYKGIKQAPVPQQDSALELDNVEILLEQISDDPSTSTQFMQYWSDRLTNEIQCAQRRSEYAFLYGRLISEWISSGSGFTDNATTPEDMKPETLAEEASAKLETEQQLRSMIFAPAKIEVENVQAFLHNEIFNFDSKEDKEFLETIREDVRQFGDSLCNIVVSQDTVKHTIDGLLKTDLLSADNQSMLREVRTNEMILMEFASVLNVLLRNLKNWHWPEEGLPIELRRGINGKYRAFMMEDIITALFLQYIGAEWCVFLKQKFISIYESNLWSKPDVLHKGTIEGHRQALQRSTFLLSSLPNSVEEQAVNAYSDDHNDATDEKGGAKSAMDIKHGLLHLLNVEARLHQTLKPDQAFTIVRSDFEWFGPSIPHQVILVFLEFLGVPKLWVDFFHQYLKTPVLLPSDKTMHVRQRGVPISYLLSTVFSETLLFGLDLYVNRSTGIFLYRIHDDLWFWDSDTEKVELAWNNINRFSDVMGLKLNLEKSGSVSIFSKEKLSEIATSDVPISGLPSPSPVYYGQGSLPQDTVKWGFLVLHSDGAFHVDHSSMRTYIEEMEGRLAAASSIIEWVNTFNKYIAFFLRNFGKYANVFGTQHADQIIEALKMIESTIFREYNGNMLAHVSSMIKDHIPSFQECNIPDAWMYWPLTSGGLGLISPFLMIVLLRASLKSNKCPEGFNHLLEKDAMLYNKQKAAYEKARGPVYRYADSEWDELDDVDSDDKQFAGILVEERAEDGHKVKRMLSFEEYCEGRESRLAHWYALYEELLSNTQFEVPSLPMPMSENYYDLTSRMDGGDSDGDLGTYWKWIVCHYSSQLLSMFGNLHFMNSELVPMGLLSVLKTMKVKFEE